MLQSGSPPEEPHLGDLEALQGVAKFPVRVKCALLAWMTLREALDAWREGTEKPQEATTTEESSR
jgi:nitrogen fixation NifU-like protein